ncbi:MAG: DUF2156 domain-containing protein [Ruminiclostridium sp.]
MLELKRIEMSDKDWIKELLSYSDFRGCEYTFGNNFTWRNAFDVKVARFKDFYIVESNGDFFFPAGRGNVAEVVEELKAYCRSQNRSLCFSSMNKATMEMLSEMYGDIITVDTNRDYYDYIYSAEALSTLGGKKLHAKRNHINRFKENNWSYEEITAQNIDECKALNEKWCEENICVNDLEKSEESCVVRCGLKHFFELGYVGGLLRANGEIQAFTFGEPVNSDTFVVHVEKALTTYQGAYPMINYQFVNHACKGYKYINREEDMGAENLRKAKLSYYPLFMEEKFIVNFR